jgi:hypothetical protein
LHEAPHVPAACARVPLASSSGHHATKDGPQLAVPAPAMVVVVLVVVVAVVVVAGAVVVVAVVEVVVLLVVAVVGGAVVVVAVVVVVVVVAVACGVALTSAEFPLSPAEFSAETT